MESCAKRNIKQTAKSVPQAEFFKNVLFKKLLK